MRMSRVAALLLASSSATEIENSYLDDKESKLSQSIASAFNMVPPKLMTTKPLPQGAKEVCPTPGKMLTNAASGGAFIDGCYMNTTRSQARNEATGEEAQKYLYMWKHACTFTKWVPSNQFMYSNLDYDADTMTLERFGFIGMDKRCFWGSIGVLWKKPLPVEQIIPQSTVQVKIEAPKKKVTTPYFKKMVKKIIPKEYLPKYVHEGQLYNTKSAEGDCLGVDGDTILIKACATDGSDTWQEMKNGEIVHKSTGKCMTTKTGKNHDAVVLDFCTGDGLQTWLDRPTFKGQFVLENLQAKDKCVDLPGKDGARGLKAQMFTCSERSRDNFNYKWI